MPSEASKPSVSMTCPPRCWPSPGPTPTILAPQTHSRVSKVMITRMGLRFMPPTQLLLHMKLYRMVVNSVPTCAQGRQGKGLVSECRASQLEKGLLGATSGPSSR